VDYLREHSGSNGVKRLIIVRNVRVICEGSEVILSIASGKGGTGKTTVAVNMALSLGNVQLLDCDVEEPNAHLLLHPKITETKPVYTRIPTVEDDKCDYCGECAKFCRYNAIFVANQKITFFPELCSSCGGCRIVCPKNAIKEKQRKIGMTKRGSSKGVELIYGQLNVGDWTDIVQTDAGAGYTFGLRSDGTVVTVSAFEDLSIVALVGEGITEKPGIADKMISAITKKGINMKILSFGASEVAAYVVVDQSDRAEAVRAIHNAFFG